MHHNAHNADALASTLDAHGPVTPGSVYLVQGVMGSGVTLAARHLHARLPSGRPLRAPHHTASREGVAWELSLAMGGLLYLDDLIEWRPNVLSILLHTWGRVLRPARPVLVLGLVVDVDCTQAGADIWWRRLASVSGELPPIHHHILTTTNHS